MTTVVLLHGIPGSAADWTDVVGLLDGEFDVTAPDLIGFGGRANGARDLWADAQARALAGALPTEGEIALAGHDFGGPVALHLLPHLGDRVRGLVLAAANVFGDTPIPFPLNLVRLPLMPRLVFSSPSLRRMLRGHPDAEAAIGPPAQRAAIRAIFTTALRELPQRYAAVERHLRETEIPVRVVWGDRDPFFATAHGRRTATAAQAALTLVEGAGHFLPREAPEALAEAIRSL